MFYKDEDGNYVKGTIADYASDDNDTIYVVTKGTTGTNATTVDYIYIQYVDDGTVAPNFVFVGNDMTTGRVTPTGTTYTISTSSGQPIYFNVSGTGMTVYTCTDNTGAGATQVTPDAYGNARVVSSASTTTVYVKTVAVDGSSAIYTLNITVS